MLPHLLRLVFTPAQFIEVVTDSVVAEDKIENPQVMTPDGLYPADRRDSIKESVLNQTTTIRRAFFRGIATTSITISTAAACGYAFSGICGSPSRFVVYSLQIAGASFVLGATLAEVGSQIGTWGRRSIPERVNRHLFHGFYVVGTFLFVLSVAWDAA